MRSVIPVVFDAARLPDASAINPPVPIMDAGKEQAVPLRELFIRRRVASKAYPSLPNFLGPPGNLWVGEAPDGPLMNTTTKTVNLSRPADRRAGGPTETNVELAIRRGHPLEPEGNRHTAEKGNWLRRKTATQPVHGEGSVIACPFTSR